MRFTAALLAAVALLAGVRAETIPVSAREMYTLRYVLQSQQFAVLDTLLSDTVWSVRDSAQPVPTWIIQDKFVSFPLPTTVADCDCLYVVVRAYNFSTTVGRTGISMFLFPRDSTDTTEFAFNGFDYWGHYYTLDSIPYGALYEHRTYEGLDAYFQWTLNRDHPAADEIIMGIEPVHVGDTHLVVDATMYWTADGASVPPRGERSPPRVTIFPNPASDGFLYQGPECRYRLFNLLGQTVSEGTIRPGFWIPMAPHPPGTYFLLIEARSARQTITIRKLR